MDQSLDTIRKLKMNVRSYCKEFCFSCKGDKLLCNFRKCPLLKRATLPAILDREVDTTLSGPTSSLFVDWHGYPEVALGPITALNSDNAELAVTPKDWYGMSFEELITLRSQLVQSLTTHDVSSRNKFIEQLQELALSIHPVETELRFRNKPTNSLTFSDVHEPLGPTGELEYLKIQSEPKIPKLVDSEISSSTPAFDALWKLYGKGYDVYYLQRVLASGVFSEGNEPRLMPTSWAIQTVDRQLGNRLITEVNSLPYLNDYVVLSNTYLANHYEVLLIPGQWKFEALEAWAPDTLWTLGYTQPAIHQDFEGYNVSGEDRGKTGSSYYATRMAIMEGLKKLGKQATVIVFREVENEYSLPLGVWLVRETLRHAFSNKPGKFGSVEEALQDIATRLRTPLSEYTQHGMILGRNWMNN
jgi:hypothetical protein